MIHISRFVQPPNPNSAVPPSPSDRQPPHAARNGGGSRIPAHCRSRGGQCGSPPSDAVRKRSSRTVPRHRIGSPRAPYRDEAPDTGSPRTVPPPKKTGPPTRDLSEASSPKRDIAQNEVPEKRILPAESSTGRPPPKNEVFPRRTLRTRLSQNELPSRTASETKPFETGQSARMQRFAVPSLPALPSRHAAGKPQPALRPCENALRTACRPKAARELRPNGVGARKVRPPLSRPRRPDGRR